MQIYTLNVGQGQFVVVTGTNEAFIVDTFAPLNTEQETVFVKAALSRILEDKKLVGLLVTGFDADHFCEPGMKLVLNKYRPDWIMYPKYSRRPIPQTGALHRYAHSRGRCRSQDTRSF